MINEIENKAKLDKWFFHIPVIGPIIYALRFEFFINKLVLDKNHPEYKKFKITKRWKSIANLAGILIAVPFIVCFFVYRNSNGYGGWPWFFWVGLAIGVAQNISPVFAMLLYKEGIKTYIKKNHK